MNTSEQWAYLAGIIDGEGYIGAGWENKHGYVKGASINVSSIDECLIDWLCKTFGGRKDRRGRTTSNNDAFNWHVERRSEVRRLLEGALPYLVIKRRQAEALLELIDHLDSRPSLSYDTPTSRANKIERARRRFIRQIFNGKAKLLRAGIKEARHCCSGHWPGRGEV